MRLLRYSLFLLILCLSYESFGQNASTSLRGLVTDSTGAAIPGASVVIVNAANGVKADAVTNSQGEYSFQQIAPGTYTITVTASGFGKFTTTAQLLVAQPATVNMKLQVSADVVSVDVSAATETINTTDATIGNAINNETIMQLPSEGRNPQTLLALQPGVLFIGSNTQSTESRNGVVSGARSDQTNITLDGVDNNNQVNPAAFTGVLRNSLDATEQFRVTTSSSNADTGRSSGGQVNLVTKSGTNQIHGSTYWYNRSNLGVANDWFWEQGGADQLRVTEYAWSSNPQHLWNFAGWPTEERQDLPVRKLRRESPERGGAYGPNGSDRFAASGKPDVHRRRWEHCDSNAAPVCEHGS